MSDVDLLISFGIALVLGALIGLEREQHYKSEEEFHFAGMRTFSIVCLSGAVAGYLSTLIGPLLVAVFLGVIGLLVISCYAFIVLKKGGDVGITTELAFLFTFLVGLVVTLGKREIGIALGVALAVILSLKPSVKRMTAQISQEDIYATLKFAIISGVILPFLPHQTFDPYGVLSLYNIWLMVVFVSAISFAGYVSIKVLGSHRGLGLTALLGGLASSTALTTDYSSHSRKRSELNNVFVLGILLACSTMFPRMLLEVYVVARPMFLPLLLPIGGMGLVGLGISALLYMRLTQRKESQVKISNPFSLAPALKFGLFYAVVMVIAKVAYIYLGNRGIYLASIISGLTDVDAITLSVSNLVSAGKLSVHVGTRAVTLAAIANTFTKALITLIFGTMVLFKRIAPFFGLILLTGLLLAFLI